MSLIDSPLKQNACGRYYKARAASIGAPLLSNLDFKEIRLARTRNSRPVYSTDGGRLCPQCQRQLATCVCGSAKPIAAGHGIVRVRRETKGRGGKGVTVIAGIPEHLDTLKSICKQLKQRCGVGGAIKGDTLEIQGDQRTVCQEHLEKMGYQIKLSGG